ncbi:hypothetical protein DFJ77DRAFT_469385 [Powellomyces hirtus]|nr:hypothetical protein DFJ77DRAFT_469385 [Powellomyces hirtus]
MTKAHIRTLYGIQAFCLAALILLMVWAVVRSGGIVYVYGDRIVAYGLTRPHIRHQTIMFADITCITPPPSYMRRLWAASSPHGPLPKTLDNGLRRKSSMLAWRKLVTRGPACTNVRLWLQE